MADVFRHLSYCVGYIWLVCRGQLGVEKVAVYPFEVIRLGYLALKRRKMLRSMVYSVVSCCETLDQGVFRLIGTRLSFVRVM